MTNFLLFNVIGEINKEMEEKFSLFFERAIDNPSLPVFVGINSTGGDYSSAISIYNMLTSISDRLRCAITGQCSGLANLIFLAAPKERRFAFYYASMSITAISDGIYVPKNSELKDIFSKSFYLDDDILKAVFEDEKEIIITGTNFTKCRIAGLITNINEVIS